MNAKDIQDIGNLSENLMLSGGAKGADCYWAQAAVSVGHQVIHWSFEGHKSHDPDHTLKLDIETLKEADIRLEAAKLTLKRNIPYYKPWIANLLRRNWFQVQYAKTVYAVGTLNEKAVFLDDNTLKNVNEQRVDRMGVNGGTAWACQMYLDRWAEDRHKHIFSFEFHLYFYDQRDNLLYSFEPYSKQWMLVQTQLERPSGIYAAIGTRDLSDAGKAFIDTLFKR